jgi:hypothetical protein
MSDLFKEIQLHNLDPNTTIWKYLPLWEFESLLMLRALWFSTLRKFEDDFEGTVPEPARTQMKHQFQDMEKWFPDEHRKQQVRRFVEVNVADGRELIVANCWSIGETETKRMWDEYVKNNEGVVIRSSAQDLVDSLVLAGLPHRYFWIGKIEYIDFARHDEMTIYTANQAHLRAFVKSRKQFEWEKELRIATMNWITPGSLNPDGSPPNEKQKSGLVYSSDRPGIFRRTHLPTLIKEVRTAPGASTCQLNTIKFLISESLGDQQGWPPIIGQSQLHS